ncbi:hypothetical protein GE061_004584 [Apolygus lucorum]|uniref:Integrase catalytic domain-containing protein n=1 Tax=Apolygus lucorum TaxID=248454 RepID=A0A8S9X288_APOLU|nr:hypothetical protein GE061_004584 [Apolygus lucorum]
MDSLDSLINNIEKLSDVASFPLWKFEIQILFESKALHEIANGNSKLADLATEKEKEEWKRKDARARQIIVGSLDKKHRAHVLSCTNAHEMYTKLCGIFERDSEHQKTASYEQFFAYKFDQSKDMASNLSYLENLRFRLNSLSKTDANQPDKIDDAMFIAKVISCLHSNYDNFVTSWNSAPKEDKTLVNLTSRLLCEEARKSNNDSDAPVAFYTKEKRNFRQQKHKNSQKNESETQKFRCHICKNKKNNHDPENCFYRKNRKNQQNQAAFIANENPKSFSATTWIVDSAASSHMTNVESSLKGMIPSDAKITIAKNGQSIKAQSSGILETPECKLNDVLFVPDLSKNLLSVNAITQKNGKVIFEKDKVQIFQNGQLVLDGQKNSNGLFEIEMGSVKDEKALIASRSDSVNWHRKLGHLGVEYLKKLESMSQGMSLTKTDLENLKSCEVCLKSKACRKPFGHDRTRASEPLEILHTDVVGPIEIPTWDQKRYFVSILDDHTHFAAVFLLKGKDEVKKILMNYIAKVENHWSKKVKKIRMDNGGEYVSKEFKEFCDTKGIELDYTPPYTPQLNSHAERLGRTLMNKTRALMFDSNIEKEMWGFAVQTATYLLNRSPCKATDKTPAELWFKKTPDLSRLQIFGCDMYAKVLEHTKKLDPRARKLMFVGYSNNSYLLWDKENRRIISSRDAYPCKTEKSDENPQKGISLNFETDDDVSLSDHEEESNINENSDQEDTEIETSDSEDDSSSYEETTSLQNPVEDQDNETSERPRRSTRLKKLPEKLNDYELDLDGIQENAFLTYQDATSGAEKEQWLKAVEDEKQSLKKNKTWIFVDRKEANGRKILSNRWVFRKKDDEKFKARLVVRGCEQVYGEDFSETYSPVIGADSLRLLMATSLKNGFHFKTFDVKTAFLYGHIKEDIFMKVPEGYKNSETKICKLKKSLYGLKQSSLNWNRRLTDFLKKKGLFPLKNEPCIFINETKTIIMAIYVDDGAVFANDKNQLDEILIGLKKEFEITIFDNPKNFVGFEISLTPNNLKLNQASYIQRLLEKYEMNDANSVRTPMVTQNQQNQKFEEMKFPFREMVGSLLYVSSKTRPDLAYSVGYSSRHLENPSEQDFANVKRSLRYLNGTKNEGISFSKNNETDELIAFCDSDFAGDPDTRRSTSGYAIFYSGGPVSWRSRKQPIVSTSSTEAEFISAAECCRELIFLKSLLFELTGKHVPITLYIDNMSTIELIKKGKMNTRSKHIDVKYYFIKEKFDKGILDLKHCKSANQIADIFTKPLGFNKFEEFKKKLIT